MGDIPLDEDDIKRLPRKVLFPLSGQRFVAQLEIDSYVNTTRTWLCSKKPTKKSTPCSRHHYHQQSLPLSNPLPILWRAPFSEMQTKTWPLPGTGANGMWLMAPCLHRILSLSNGMSR